MNIIGKIVSMGCVFFLAQLFITASSFAEEYTVEEENVFKTQVSLKCDGREMQEVLQDLSASSGVKVLYDAELASTKVQCNYENMTTKKIVSRLFRDYSTGILIDPKAETIIVQVFGASKYMLASAREEGKTLNLPFLGDMTQEELNELHTTQYEEYQKELADDSAGVPGTDISRGDLQVLHDNQYNEYKESLNNPNKILEGVGVSRGELEKTHARQYEQYKKDMEDDTVAVPGMKVTRGELRELHKKQYEEYQKNINDPNALIPGVGITRGELKKLHEQQMQSSSQDKDS